MLPVPCSMLGEEERRQRNYLYCRREALGCPSQRYNVDSCLTIRNSPPCGYRADQQQGATRDEERGDGVEESEIPRPGVESDKNSSIQFARRLPSVGEGVYPRRSRTSKEVVMQAGGSLRKPKPHVSPRQDLSKAKVDLVFEDARGRGVDAGRGLALPPPLGESSHCRAGIVRDYDNRIKPGEKVKIAASFANEDWCKPYVGQVGVLVEPDPSTQGCWPCSSPSADSHSASHLEGSVRREQRACFLLRWVDGKVSMLPRRVMMVIECRFHLVYDEEEEQGTDDESDSSGPDL
eukprot:761518-Hanusia_phi.AAC.3